MGLFACVLHAASEVSLPAHPMSVASDPSAASGGGTEGGTLNSCRMFSTVGPGAVHWPVAFRMIGAAGSDGAKACEPSAGGGVVADCLGLP